jgi:hypothetical protein
MKKLLAAVALALVVTPLGGATARTLVLRAPLSGLAADGARAAIVVGSRRRDCTHVVIWSSLNGQVIRLGRPAPCVQTSTGSGIARVSFARPRALWLSYAGGNIREWSLWTASVSRRRPVRIAFEPVDVDLPSPIVLGEGDNDKDGRILPYAIRDTVYSLGIDGRRVFSWKAPDTVVALAAKNGELAVALESGPVVILDAAGHVLRTEPFAGRVDAVAITGNALLVQHGQVLELRGGLVPKTWELSGQWRLTDAVGNIAVYTRGHEIHAFDLDNGKDVVVRRTSARPFAQIESGGGLVYGAGRRVSVVPTREVVRLLRN